MGTSPGIDETVKGCEHTEVVTVLPKVPSEKSQFSEKEETDMERIKNYLLCSAVLIIAVLVMTLTDVRRAVADEFKDVRVINTESMPAKVRDADNAARHPTQARANCSDDEGSCGVLIYVVPAGKRLVIEYASMRAHATGAQISRMQISTVVAGEEILHYLPPTPPAPTVDSDTSVGQVVRLYADAGTPVLVSGSPTNSSVTAFYGFAISGYLVDVQ